MARDQSVGRGEIPECVRGDVRISESGNECGADAVGQAAPQQLRDCFRRSGEVLSASVHERRQLKREVFADRFIELLRADVVENFYSRDAEAVQSLLVRLNALQRGHFSGVALRDAPLFARKIGSYIY